MPKPRKADLEDKLGVPVYTGWHLVPLNLHARNWYKKSYKVVIPDNAEPDAIKGGGKTTGGPGYYFLFDENKYLPEELRTKVIVERAEAQKAQRPKLRTNGE